jgi:hypothetical protein
MKGSQGLRIIAIAGAIFLFSGGISSITTAAVWVQKTQLQQYWLGSQWKDSTSDTNGYESRGLINTAIHAVLQGANGLIDNTLTLNEYDSEKEQTSSLIRGYDKAQGQWQDTVAGTKWTRYKDANKQDTVIESQVLNSANSKWYKQTRWRYYYHQDTLIDSSIYAVWDTSGGVGKWQNITRTIETYGSGSKSVLTTIDGWSKGDARWLKQTRTARVYANSLLASDTTATWDTATSKYIYNMLHIYAYNSDNLDTSMITMTYNKSLDVFLNILREIYTYDGNKNKTTDVSFRWTKNPDGNGIWLQTNRQTYTYTGQLKILTTLYETYDSASSAWNKGNYQEWAYDGNGNAQSETFSFWDTVPNPDAFTPVMRLTWTYIQLTTGTNRPAVSSINPAVKTSIRVKDKNIIVTGQEGMTVSVFGINGRKLASLTAPEGRSTVAWNYTDDRGMRVPMGSYILKISGKGLNAVFPVAVYR